MKMYWGSRGIQLHVRPLYPQGRSSQYPLDRRLGGPQSRSGCGGKERTEYVEKNGEIQLVKNSIQNKDVPNAYK